VLIPLDSVAENFLGLLKHDFTGLKPGKTGKNIQARLRGAILMAFANKFDCLCLNTCNKSDTTLGRYTLYGDSAGAVAVIADLYTTQIYELAAWLNKTRNFELIPREILQKPSSPQLGEDADRLPEYRVLDAMLSAFLEEGNDEDELVELGFERNMVKNILRMSRRAEFKRRQAPPVLRVSEHSFRHRGKMPLATLFHQAFYSNSH
jgi:NAD+ synthase (glutamine-hydrolysing)